MAQIYTSSPHDVTIEHVFVDSERLPKTYDIVRNVAEINLFENIDLPYIHGSILISDSSDILTKIGFRGTERITIRMRITGDERAKSVEKKFVVMNIGGVAPVNDTAEAMTLDIIEEFGYQSRLVTVSKAYSGKPETIISKIMYDNLKKRVDVPQSFTGSNVRPLKVVVPSITPIAAARWIKNRMINENGMPFFLYSTLNKENLVLADLEYLLGQQPTNLAYPFSFGQAFTRYTTNLSIDQQARVIEAYSMAKSENMYNMARSGVLNSTYTYVNPTLTGSPHTEEVKVSMTDIIKMMVDKGILERNQNSPIYDDKFMIDGKTIDEYNPSTMTQITPSNTYEDFANYYEAHDIQQQKLKAYSRALRYYLLKSPLDITMPGFYFLGRGENTTIGSKVRLNFLKNDPQIAEKAEDALDPKRSGDYLIYNMRHIIRPENYTVSMTCVKLGEKRG